MRYGKTLQVQVELLRACAFKTKLRVPTGLCFLLSWRDLRFAVFSKQVVEALKDKLLQRHALLGRKRFHLIAHRRGALDRKRDAS